MGLAPADTGPHLAVAGLPHALLPRPPEGGPPLLPYASRPPRAQPLSVPLAVVQRSRPPGAGSGTRGALCLEHMAPSCPRCKSLEWGISRYCRAGHEGHGGPAVGLRPDGNASGRVGPPSHPATWARGGEGAVILARLGAPRFPGPPGCESPGCPLVRATTQDAGGPSPMALGPESPRHPKRPKRNLPTD